MTVPVPEMDATKSRLTMKKIIRIIGPKELDEGVRCRMKHVIKIPRLNTIAEVKPPTSSHRNNVSTPYTTKGLVIVVPPARTTKRGRVSGREDEEDITSVAVKRPSSKRARKSEDSKDESDENSLISTLTYVPVRTQRKPKSKRISKRTSITPLTVDSCSYSGQFDLYAMDHQDLCQIYRPEDSRDPQYEDLYKALRSNDHIQELTAHVSLPTIPYGRKYGSALTPALCDPISERPYNIELTRISRVNQVFYREHEKECFVTRYNSDVSGAGKMPGVSGKTGVAAAAAGDNGVLESSGDFNLSRVWVKRDTEGRLMEIFEGYMSLKVRYCKEYERKGYGEGFNVGFAFWALRTSHTG
ncbi:hypothetical protein LENED_012300 [Lentinula edodes]|uniref:Uncharacterized protein n=1 Tax=Lentinula edodes TaxID=5353 RepID=A0A1Q3ESB7_LENED|nr:hypothetical protein LENED_012300 [Lentinula edodes]